MTFALLFQGERKKQYEIQKNSQRWPDFLTFLFSALRPEYQPRTEYSGNSHTPRQVPGSSSKPLCPAAPASLQPTRLHALEPSLTHLPLGLPLSVNPVGWLMPIVSIVSRCCCPSSSPHTTYSCTVAAASQPVPPFPAFCCLLAKPAGPPPQ